MPRSAQVRTRASPPSRPILALPSAAASRMASRVNAAVVTMSPRSSTRRAPRSSRTIRPGTECDQRLAWTFVRTEVGPSRDSTASASTQPSLVRPACLTSKPNSVSTRTTNSSNAIGSSASIACLVPGAPRRHGARWPHQPAPARNRRGPPGRLATPTAGWPVRTAWPPLSQAAARSFPGARGTGGTTPSPGSPAVPASAAVERSGTPIGYRCATVRPGGHLRTTL